jgi:hypothetical protein
LGPEALRCLEEAALELMNRRQFAEALAVWETRLRAGGTGLAPFPLYAQCLAAVGRIQEARDLCGRTAKAIAELGPGERRDELRALLLRVARCIDGEPAVPSPDLQTLFGGEENSS